MSSASSCPSESTEPLTKDCLHPPPPPLFCFFGFFKPEIQLPGSHLPIPWTVRGLRVHSFSLGGDHADLYRAFRSATNQPFLLISFRRNFATTQTYTPPQAQRQIRNTVSHLLMCVLFLTVQNNRRGNTPGSTRHCQPRVA